MTTTPQRRSSGAPSAQRSPRQPSLAAQALREHRVAHGLSQEQFAYELGIEPRTLRRYETGERALDNVAELRRIAEVTGIAPERLGIAAVQEAPRTPAEIEATVERVWSLVEASRMAEASAVAARLIGQVQAQLDSDDPALLRSLAHAYHAAGYATAVGTRFFEADRAIPAYH
jgi:transcriptional regulator with XRE-family HTH domain